MKQQSDRLRIARLAAGHKTVRDAAERFGWKYSTYNAHETGQNKFREDAARDYAKAFKVDAAWLMCLTDEPGGRFAESKSTPQLTIGRKVSRIDAPLKGILQSGVFRDLNDPTFSSEDVVTVMRDPEFPLVRHLAFDVADDAMNSVYPRGIFAGDKVIGIDIDDAGADIELEVGMIVVLERLRDNGQLRELTLRLVDDWDGKRVYRPDSKSGKYSTFTINDGIDDEGVAIKVICVVNQVQHQIWPRLSASRR